MESRPANCNIRLQNEGGVYPRTCECCRLGPCPFQEKSILPFQQRVIDEKAELDERASKLSEFIGTNPLFIKLPADEQERMKEQCEIMWQYSEILSQRIAHF